MLTGPLRTLLFIGVLAALPMPAVRAAEISLDPAFSKGAVLQCELPLPVFGNGKPNSTITVTLAGSSAKATCASDGTWSTVLPALPPGGPHTLQVSDNQGAKIESADILLGEVWLCAGQSNMVFPFTKMHRPEAFAGAAGTKNPQLRLLTGSSWQTAEGDERLGSWPTTPLYFGRALQKALNRPVGLLVMGQGGTSSFMYSNPRDLAANPDTRDILAMYQRRISTPDGNKAPGPGLSLGNEPRWPWHASQTPGKLWNQIEKLSRIGVRGVIWWQGENDLALNRQYEPVFRQLIRSWRSIHVRGNDLPFIFVQLPSYQEKRATVWPESERRAGLPGLRDAQRRVLSEPGTAMVVGIDLHGSGGIHPSPKQAFGERLALTVRGAVYKERIDWCGPLLRSATTKDDTMLLTFDHAGKGLAIDATQKNLVGFQIAGEDRRFVDAEAKLVGADTVQVKAAGVSTPHAVRYAWHENPLFSLVGPTGLPASPFATDDWPLVAANDKKK